MRLDLYLYGLQEQSDGCVPHFQPDDPARELLASVVDADFLFALTGDRGLDADDHGRKNAFLKAETLVKVALTRAKQLEPRRHANLLRCPLHADIGGAKHDSAWQVGQATPEAASAL